MGYPPAQMGYHQHPGALSGNSLHESLNVTSLRQQLHPVSHILHKECIDHLSMDIQSCMPLGKTYEIKTINKMILP